ncbi:MAG: DUF3738 domain-containing protein [Bacteroidetes bacterium]|nr:DUF3738 domain-containing protein [Bacteroidota bacterium]
MKRRNTTFIALSLLFVCNLYILKGHAQPQKINSKTADHELTVGDKVPNFHFGEVMNYPLSAADLSRLQNDAKLTILDVWSTSCSSCIALFPHMQQMKEKFGDRLQVILVNGKTQVWHDNQPKINNVLKRLQAQSGISIALPIVLNSKEFDLAFPFQTVPEEIWINSAGEIVGITGSQEVNEKNINAILNGEHIKMHLKKDALFDITKTPLQEWLYGPSDADHIPLYSSTIWRGFIDGLKGNGCRLPPGVSAGPIKQVTGLYVLNQSLYGLVETAWAEKIRVRDNQVLIETDDTTKLFKGYPTDSVLYNRVYSYDITVPPTDAEDVRNYVREDLKRLFHIDVRYEKRNINCWMVKARNVKLSKSNEKADWSKINQKEIYKNYSIAEILEIVNENSSIPIIDDTHLTGKMDFEFPATLHDLVTIKSALESAGFEVVKSQKEMDVVIISDKPNK